LFFCQENLIPNPSFEDLSDCPDIDPLPTPNLLELAPPWYGAIWTPDLFNSCAGSSPYGVPENRSHCYQYPRTGEGYSGFSTYFNAGKTTEYMGIKLKKKLKENSLYYISFYVSPANCSSVCFSDAIGIAFSDTFFQKVVSFNEEFVPDLIPAVKNPKGNVLIDTLNWIKIDGSYIAKGGEEYAILGSFIPNSETYSAECVGATGSYKYIDDVGVYEFNPLPDTLLLCQGQTATIGASFLDGSYQWNTGASDSTILVSQPGTYILTVAIDDCLLSDTVVVVQPDETLNALPSDTLICRGDPLLLHIPMPGIFEWSTGETGNSIAISEAGFYSALIHNECGDFYYATQVDEEVCSCDPFIPNAFSPNNDGVNDHLLCFLHCDFPYRLIRFQVFSRWGELLYADDSGLVQNIRWDGTFNGKPLETGIYLWTFEYEYERHGKTRKEILSGTVTLVR
jgi:gliding motility-associated-like protein